MSFVQTYDGWISFDLVARFKLNSEGYCQAVLKDGTIVETPNFEDAAISLVPSQGDWECVIADGLDNDPLHTVEPILAWARTICGALRPCTMSHPEGVTARYAARRHGSDTVYSEKGTFSSVGEWLNWETKRAHQFEDSAVKPGRTDE